MSRVWQIECFDSNELLYRDVAGLITDAEIKTMLGRLAARHLAPSEIVGASLRKNMVGYRGDCEITSIGGARHGWMTNGNPHYVAWVKVGDDT